jgi:hypothetical protein
LLPGLHSGQGETRPKKHVHIQNTRIGRLQLHEPSPSHKRTKTPSAPTNCAREGCACVWQRPHGLHSEWLHLAKIPYNEFSLNAHDWRSREMCLVCK